MVLDTHTQTHTHTQPFYGSLDSVRDNPGEPVHEKCEWVNVSSGTGSPGLSQTKSRKP